MLYITTRNPADSFTAHRVLSDNQAADGALFVPMQMPVLSETEIRRLKDRSFGDTVAQILNLFFDMELTGWDVEFSIGRTPIQLSAMNHRMTVVQLWHNHMGDYQYLEKSLYARLCGQTLPQLQVPQWPRIAIRVAVFFGIYSQLPGDGKDCFDIAVPVDDFQLGIALWYARNMGLPVGRILCGCSKNSGIWDLIHRGEYATIADCTNVERLIFDAFGRDEVRRYLTVCQRRGIFQLDQEQQQLLAERFYIAVVSEHRVESIVKSFYQTNGYFLDLSTAVSYGALQDCRARTGESRHTVLLADKSPVHSASVIQRILGIAGEDIKKLNA